MRQPLQLQRLVGRPFEARVGVDERVVAQPAPTLDEADEWLEGVGEEEEDGAEGEDEDEPEEGEVEVGG